MKKLIITCEHGGNNIPPEYKNLFEGKYELLNSHRGYDIGAIEIFDYIKSGAEYSTYSKTSRLLVELNRSLNHKNLFSDVTKHQDAAVKENILNKYYFPYRKKVEENILKFLDYQYKVIHLSVHTFTPVLDKVKRNCDIGLLYDPRNQIEKSFCRSFKTNFISQDNSFKIRFNYPYLGTADGFTSYLRRKFGIGNYAGIELEVNQKYFTDDLYGFVNLKLLVKNSLLKTMAEPVF